VSEPRHPATQWTIDRVETSAADRTGPDGPSRVPPTTSRPGRRLGTVAVLLAALVALGMPGRSLACAPEAVTPTATATPEPTETPEPTATPAPTWDGLSIAHLYQGRVPVERTGLGPARQGWLEGEEGVVVYDPVNDPSRSDPITDFDLIEGGVLWENKSADRLRFSPDTRHAIMTELTESERPEFIRDAIVEWSLDQVYGKLRRLLRARAFLPFYRDAPIGFYLQKPDPSAFAERASKDPLDPDTEAKETALFREELQDVIAHVTKLSSVEGVEMVPIRWDD
jgi:hypothetical protein